MVEIGRYHLPTGPLVLVLVILSLFLIIAHLPVQLPTGATIRSNAGYDYVIEQEFTGPGTFSVELDRNPTSVAISADVIGGGSATVFLRTATGMKNVFSVDGDSSAVTQRRKSVRRACDETCANLAIDNVLDLDIMVNSATLVLHNISYTVSGGPTGAAVLNTADGTRQANTITSAILSCDVLDWLQIALTIITVMLIVFGPLRETRQGRKASVPAAIGIMALVAATGMLAVLDAINCDYIPIAVLVVTLVSAITLDILLVRAHRLPLRSPFHEDRLSVFQPGDGVPDEREIRRRLDEIRRRLRE